ncbi:MAG: efflux RND transporter periplasmic adaptor subunit, partial [Anaerolineales bacterium]|nr:efflux RND transporter periplasmic adaptor subunit [Anaerolineales bacterium]
IAPGQLVNYQTINLTASTSGLVEEVNGRPGDSVEKGQLLVVLDDTSAQEKLTQAQRAYSEMVSPAAIAEAEWAVAVAKQEHVNARYTLEYMISPAVFYWERQLENAQEDLAEAKADYDKNPSNKNEQAIKEAESAVIIAEKELSQALYNYENEYIHKTFDNKPSDSRIQEARAKYKLTRERKNEAEIYLDALRKEVIPKGAVGEDIEQFEQAIINLQNAQQSLEDTKVYAPISGTILTLNAQVGAMTSEGSKLLQIADPHALEVLVSVIEEDYPLLKIGQTVDLFFDAAPDVTATGQVDRIVPKRVSNDRPLYPVYISIDDFPEVVVEGMTADADIILAQSSDVLRLPRALVKANSDGTAMVSVWMGDHEEERSVTVGLRGDLFIEILSGLEEGEKVVGQ